MNSPPLQFLASAPRGLADLLARELAEYGATDVRERSTGVAFKGTLATAYRACLHSRVANRVFLELASGAAEDADGMYRLARTIDWPRHIGPGATIACDFSGRHPAITHTNFGALRIKDAIVDTLRDATGTRPDVAVSRPDVRIHAHATDKRVAISLDLAGESLHRRGYRGDAGEAPLKENVAAGILLRMRWPELVEAGTEFLDPMCGSGTLVIEAALIAANMAPNLEREYFGFKGWRQHDAPLWEHLREEARAAARTTITNVLRGTDMDPEAIHNAAANARRAGVSAFVRFDVQAIVDATPAGASGTHGLLCVNPPYGVRMQDHETARVVHRELGQVLRERFQGWDAAVLTGAPELGLELGIRAHRSHTIWNGSLECRLLRLKIEPGKLREPHGARGVAHIDTSLRDTAGARMFANRLGKNLKRLRSWARANDVSCYRIYDADMPEYAFAIDSYETVDAGQRWLYVQEYAPPASIDLEAARRRRNEAFSVLPEVLDVPPERIRVRLRRRQSRGSQYRKLDEQSRFHVVAEGGLRFLVNFDDYLDTGLFLDHRPTRALLRDAAAGKRFLNLFAYTGTATVYTAAGGARSTTTVDMSNTYLDWARRNLELNGYTGHQHTYIQADCREWLAQAGRELARYDLVFLDPPTFSNSKRMEGVLDILRDHAGLIDGCAHLLAPGGLLVFSTNAEKFMLDADLNSRYAVRDISRESVPRDFERNPRIHRCYEIRLNT